MTTCTKNIFFRKPHYLSWHSESAVFNNIFFYIDNLNIPFLGYVPETHVTNVCEGFAILFTSTWDILARSRKCFIAWVSKIQGVLLVHYYFGNTLQSSLQISVGQTRVITVITLSVWGPNSAYDDMYQNSEIGQATLTRGGNLDWKSLQIINTCNHC